MSAQLMSTRFAALGDPVRLRIVETLSSKPRTVTEISRNFDMTMAGVLKHIRILQQAEVVHMEKTGRVVTCSLNKKSLESVADWTQKQIDFWEAGLLRLKKLVEKND